MRAAAPASAARSRSRIPSPSSPSSRTCSSRRRTRTARSEREVAEDCGDILEQTGLLRAANRLGGSLTLLDRKRLELARALAAEAAPAPARRDRRRADRRRMRRAGRDDRRHQERGRRRSSGSSTSCMRCWPWSTGCVVLEFRPQDRRGRAARGDGLRRGARDLHGHRGLSRCALLETRGLTAFYGDFQALFGVSIDVEEGETVAIIGANGAGKSTLLRSHRRPAAAPARSPIRFDGERDRRRWRRRRSCELGIAMVPEGRRLFPSLSVEENLLVGGDLRRGRGHWDLDDDLSSSSRRSPTRRSSPATSLSGGEQQMVGDRPRADVEPAPAALRRAQPRPRAGRDPRHLRGAAGDPRARARRSSSSSRTSQRALARRRSRLLPDGGPRHARRRAARSVARGDPRRLFRRRGMTQLARHADPGRPARRALRALRDEPVADLRHHAARQPRAWRPDRARDLPDPASSPRRSASPCCSRSRFAVAADVRARLRAAARSC